MHIGPHTVFLTNVGQWQCSLADQPGHPVVVTDTLEQMEQFLAWLELREVEDTDAITGDDEDASADTQQA